MGLIKITFYILFFTYSVNADQLLEYRSFSNQSISKTASNTSNQIIFWNFRDNKTENDCTNTNCGSYHILYDIEIDLLGYSNHNKNSVEFYAGKSANVRLEKNQYGISIGRMHNPFYSKVFNQWLDGTDGLVVYHKSDKYSVYFNLLDYYSGYTISDKFYLLNEEQKEKSTGNRLRSSITTNYHSENLEASLHFSYINLMNWGNFSNDEPVKKGDYDYIYHFGGIIKNTTDFYELGLLLMISKGMDKTQYNFSSKSSSIPIAGELLGVMFSLFYDNYKLNASIYIPDSDKIDSNGEVKELGFVGIGSSPIGSPLLLGNLNLFPSNWITHKSLERSDTFKDSRRNSAWSQINLSVQLSNFNLNIYNNYIMHRKNNQSSKGNISISLKNYDTGYISETGIQLEYKEPLVKYFVSIQYSYLLSSFEEKNKYQFISIKGGIRF